MGDQVIDYDELLRFAKTLEGQTLHTNAGRSRFKVRVDGDNFVFTPLSTGLERTAARSSTEKVLQRHRNTDSTKPGDYNAITVNSVYLMRLISLLKV